MTVSRSPGKWSQMFVYKLCFMEKGPWFFWSGGDYFLPGCCLEDLAVISAKLNDLETQTRSQQTAGKNQLNGRGAVVRQKIHTETHIYPQACTHTHTLCKHIKTPQVYKTTTHTFFRSWCILPERLQTGFLWRNASIQMLQNRVV